MEKLFNEKINRKNMGSIKWDKQKNLDALPFWVADSDYKTAPAVIDALAKRVKEGHFGYTYYTDEYFESICSWYFNRYQAKVNKEWIVPITGVVLAVKIAIDAFTLPNEEVIIQTPVYHQFERAIKESKRKVVESPLINENEKYHIDFEDLEEKLKRGAKMLVFCSPHNPVGRVWTKEELKETVELCKKYDAYLVSDEIHNDLIMPGYRFTSMVSVSEYPKLIICSAPSKTFNLAGLDSSYAIIKDEGFRKRYEQQKNDYFLPRVNVLAIEATISAYQKGADWVDAQNKHIYENYLTLVDFLKHEFPKVKLPQLEGTYLAWLDLTYLNLSSEELLKRLSDAGITVNSGKSFGFEYDGYIRFNLACSKEQLSLGLSRLKKALKQE